MFFLSWLNESVLANATNSPGWIEIIGSILAALQKQEGYGMAERRNLSQKKPLGPCSPESLKFPRKKYKALIILIASFVWIFLFAFQSVSWQCRWPLALRREVLLELDVELVIWAAAFWRGSQEKYWNWLHSPGSEVTWLVWTSIILGCAAGISGWCHAKQVAWEPKGTAVGNNGYWKVTRAQEHSLQLQVCGLCR